MKLLIYVNHIGKGGHSRQAAQLANSLASGADTVYLLTDLCRTPEYVLSPKVNRPESVCETGDSKAGVILRNLKKKIAELCPDVILAFGRVAGKRIVKISSGKHRIYLADYKTPGEEYAGKKEYRDTLKLYQMVDGIVVQTREAKEFWPEKLQQKIHIILPFMREKYYGNMGTVLPFSERKPEIAYTGTFKEGSGHLALVKAFEKILEDYPDYILAFYGDRSEDNTIFQVQELVRAHKLTNQVKFLGKTTLNSKTSGQLGMAPEQTVMRTGFEPDKTEDTIRVALENAEGSTGRGTIKEEDFGGGREEALLQSRVFVMPAIAPGISVSLMEAMASGLPVVASDHEMGSVRTVIEDGYNGLTFQAGNEEELYIAIKKYLDYPMEAERIAKEAVKVKETFSKEKILQYWRVLWEG